MRPQPVQRIASFVNAAVVDAARQGVRNCGIKRLTAGNSNGIIATNSPSLTKIVVIRLTVIRRILLVVRRAEILILEGAWRRTVDVDTAVEPISAGCGVAAKVPLWIAVAQILWWGCWIFVGDSNTVCQQGAILETFLEASGVCIMVGRRGL